ncbi:hypothetical protein CBR_g12744 [Chara braunii]|uniref:Protein LHCP TRANSLOCATION DEFECT n=1 Tax=Chara braunii TaxID=69332 RepID=A0A388KSH1_CHABU|nr:hypothetical protein CBR_g12744 [Chara braunii]|eukprot:GBG73025.1 hypothetical protein CBR_g12744 [Chara braunii]
MAAASSSLMQCVSAPASTSSSSAATELCRSRAAAASAAHTVTKLIPDKCKGVVVRLASTFSRNAVAPPSRLSRLGPSGGSKWDALFKFGKFGFSSEDAGMYGSQGRDDYGRDDVEQYFNYTGMLAVEGTYDKMYALLDMEIHPVDILLLFAATEGDRPKIQELLKAGARIDVEDVDGRTAVDRAADEEIKQLILKGAQAANSSLT